MFVLKIINRSVFWPTMSIYSYLMNLISCHFNPRDGFVVEWEGRELYGRRERVQLVFDEFISNVGVVSLGVVVVYLVSFLFVYFAASQVPKKIKLCCYSDNVFELFFNGEDGAYGLSEINELKIIGDEVVCDVKSNIGDFKLAFPVEVYKVLEESGMNTCSKEKINV